MGSSWQKTFAQAASSSRVTRSPVKPTAPYSCEIERMKELLASDRRDWPKSALKPGGTLNVIDFDRTPGKSRKFIMGHIRAGKGGGRDLRVLFGIGISCRSDLRMESSRPEDALLLDVHGRVGKHLFKRLDCRGELVAADACGQQNCSDDAAGSGRSWPSAAG